MYTLSYTYTTCCEDGHAGIQHTFYLLIHFIITMLSFEVHNESLLHKAFLQDYNFPFCVYKYILQNANKAIMYVNIIILVFNSITCSTKRL